MRLHACVLMLLLLGSSVVAASERKTAERASTTRWILPLFSAPEHVLKEEKELIEKIGKSLCHNYSENDFIILQKILRKSGERFLGREVPLARAYMHLQCHENSIANVDLIRMGVENPIQTGKATMELIHYFVNEIRDKFLLGKILMCRRDFGRGCVNVFEHIEQNLKIAKERELPYTTKALNFLKGLLHYNLGEEHLKRHLGLCRVFLQEPEHCGNR